ncbi:endonuclease/exonuclease/phosphatase family protein [Halopseudomonas salegens]|uniref:Uncharacterized conserved protein YafD, endonuclease/exonuclease/phosphatase (EEP) superfamily n=1 Tax=Halopseudomonas salegens TaxID=1434072 RepID=A0A1H2F1W6_9GAMM|nr:endonuclease/exonuclease/phosphatase family protein [Halopseudomonas salegens]SDU01253.1 Uncharacterized conserved protein YafD, endonuclease/exonuclease/phosphatase (EEP) superfamily [Halopseudomonas salegens]
MTILLALLTVMLAAVTLLGRLPIHDWWARVCEFPRLQIVCLALPVALLGAFLTPPPGQWLIPLICSLVIIKQVARILPWTALWPVQMQTADTGQADRKITIMVANVLTSNHNSDALIEQVHAQQPDILLTLESDAWWQAQLDEALGDWPHSVCVPQDNLYGMHLYSRLALEETQVSFLIQDDIPSIHTWIRLPCGECIYLHALHPRPPAPNESEESLWRDAELLLIGKKIHQGDYPAIVAGDLNDVAWSRTSRLFRRISGMLDPRRGRGMFNSFHAHYWFLRWPLDHVFTTEHFTLSRMHRLKDFGSDHFPIIATLCYRPSRATEHDAPSANPDERQHATEQVQEGKRREQ